ncbi:MAG: Bax inhibitor-1/YccA family protein [Armatimonadetes bacterium]|nr:Bax inhibitor-1/YccA family protein [Armatimonadota bacterium]
MRNDRQNQRSPFQVSNPAFKESAYTAVAMPGEASATAAGAISKTAILLAIVMLTSVVGWAVYSAPLAIFSFIACLGMGFWIVAKPAQAAPLAMAYAAIQGLGVGFISRAVNISIASSENANALLFRGAIPIAMGGTLLVTGVMLALYRAKIIRVTETFKSVVIGATIAIGITYLLTMLAGVFFKEAFQLPIYQPTGIGIAFSVVVIVLAAMNLVLDFNWIEAAETNRSPKYMEWYTGWGLMVTIVWLYIEILRLLMKLANRK